MHLNHLYSYSPHAQLLPYYEQENLQNLIDFNQPLMTGFPWAPVLNPAMQDVASTVISLLICPSDTGEVMDQDDNGDFFAGTNYLMNGGSAEDLEYCTE